MNRQELRERLIVEGVSEFAYSLDGGFSGEQYVLSDDGYGSWSVYYSEKGHRLHLRTFRTEDEACSHILQLILDNHTTRKTK
jgi:hypothetical protein